MNLRINWLLVAGYWLPKDGGKMYTAKVYVQLKEGILDPQGQTVVRALMSLGYKNVSDVRVGKFIELKMEGKDKKTLASQVDEMSNRLLSNPVIESYTFDVEEEG